MYSNFIHLAASDLIYMNIKIIMNLDIAQNILVIISKPKELDQLFISLLDHLRNHFPYIRIKMSESYLSLLGKDYHTFLRIIEIILDWIYTYKD